MNGPRSRPSSTLLLVLAAVTAVVLGLISPASAAAPYCGITWGSLAESDGDLSTPGVTVTDVRAGQHACYDRLVVDLSRFVGLGGYQVEYGDVVRESGQPVPLRGAADLRIVVHAPAYEDGTVTFSPADQQEVVPVTGYRTFRQVAWAGSFEGYTTLGLGVRARLPFRVFAIPGAPGTSSGGRLVIDVAHRW